MILTQANVTHVEDHRGLDASTSITRLNFWHFCMLTTGGVIQVQRNQRWRNQAERVVCCCMLSDLPPGTYPSPGWSALCHRRWRSFQMKTNQRMSQHDFVFQVKNPEEATCTKKMLTHIWGGTSENFGWKQARERDLWWVRKEGNVVWTLWERLSTRIHLKEFIRRKRLSWKRAASICLISSARPLSSFIVSANAAQLWTKRSLQISVFSPRETWNRLKTQTVRWEASTTNTINLRTRSEAATDELKTDTAWHQLIRNEWMSDYCLTFSLL